MLKNTKGVGMYIAMLVLLSLLAVAMFSMGKPVSKYKYHEIINYFKQDQVENFVVDFNNGDLLVTVKNQKEQVLYELPDIVPMWKSTRWTTRTKYLSTIISRRSQRLFGSLCCQP